MRLTLLLLFVSSSLLAQEFPSDSVQLWLVQTADGNEYVGEIIEQTPGQIRLLTRNLGEIMIRNDDIESMKPIDPQGFANAQSWRRGPYSTRYFITPSGYNLARGEGYYQNTWVLFNQARVGLTDHVSVGLGLIPLFLFAGAPTPIWITPKVSIPISPDRVNLGIGALAGIIAGEASTAFGTVYGVSTFGSRNKNLTVGLGYGFADESWSDIPLITISGTAPLGKRSYFLSENYIVSGEGETVVIASLGARSLTRSVSFDYGLFFPLATLDSFIFIPWLSITAPFGQ
ncbi:hypothetical protein [Tunicatimonas pelagia]|uniref:hypothetical protein n=1 Tax=Tunicatimonas pelagia TaxID=931531 RepID=UPI0026662895|nr:hypothetical protein [Tunicatimonas pelagia]WKN43402.1 hypothetical protein P0M28_00260 [Tunicatimonas pelagia]